MVPSLPPSIRTGNCILEIPFNHCLALLIEKTRIWFRMIAPYETNISGGTMQTRKLGNSDLTITPVGFGAWAIGGAGYDFGWGPQEYADSIAAIHRALELGVNWIDTAAVYGLGRSEEVVARALKDWRGPRPYVFTKRVLRWGETGRVTPQHSAGS